MKWSKNWTVRGAGVAVSILIAFVSLALFFELNDIYTLKNLESKHSIFGKEKGDYSFTLVTGLFDIGRGSWWRQGRTYRQYLGYLLQVLKLDVNLIVFIEEKGKSFVKRNRKGREERTAIFTFDLTQLDFFPLLSKIEEVMSQVEFKVDNINYKAGTVEATSPYYNLVTNSKISLVHYGATQNPFGSDYFIWMDGGFGHGDGSIFPHEGVWSPRYMLSQPERVTFVALDDLTRIEKKEVETLYKTGKVYIAGGLFGGGKSVLGEFHALYRKVFTDNLSRGFVDDDQTTFVSCYTQKPQMFHAVPGSWYSGLKEPVV